MAGKGVHRLRIPSDGGELAGAAIVAEPSGGVGDVVAGAVAAHGAGDAVGVVEGLDAGFAGGVGFALVGGVEGIALDFFGAALHYADKDAVGGGAVAAEAGVPVILAADQVLGEANGALDAEFAFADAEAFAGHGAGGG